MGEKLRVLSPPRGPPERCQANFGVFSQPFPCSCRICEAHFKPLHLQAPFGLFCKSSWG